VTKGGPARAIAGTNVKIIRKTALRKIIDSMPLIRSIPDGILYLLARNLSPGKMQLSLTLIVYPLLNLTNLLAWPLTIPRISFNAKACVKNCLY
jgi:hypothetical protein